MIRGTAILAALALAAVAAQAQLRTIPADAKRGTLSHLQETIVLLDGKQARLSQGAQIRDHDIRTVAAQPEVLARLEGLGNMPKLMTPDEFSAFTVSEKERWGKIIRQANIRLE